MQVIIDQIISAAAGYFLGILTAVWIHAIWKWWHPHTIRYWGAWYTSPRLLYSTGLALAVSWLVFLVKSMR
jgi:hypothetical protein